MDLLHAIGFYVSAVISLGGGLLVAFLPGRGGRGLGLAIAGAGLVGLFLSLSAGLAAAVALVCFAGCASLVAGPAHRAVETPIAGAWRQLGALAAAGLLAVLAYAAWRGDFVHVKFNGGEIGAAAVGRLLLAHDALATEAVGALVLVALAGATAARRLRDRGR
jgi:hypothetical protein